MSDQLRIGFLGAGLIATYHSKSLRHSGMPVARTGVYDPDPDAMYASAANGGESIAVAVDHA